MKSSRHPPPPAGAPAARTGWRRVGRALALGLLVIGLPLQGLGVAAERIAARAHVHLDAADALYEHGHDHGHGHDHPVEAAVHVHADAHAHAADDHHHGAEAAGVLYIDAAPSEPAPAQAPHRGIADLETLTDPPAATALLTGVPGAAPRASGRQFRSHTGTPLERPPR